MGKPAIRWGWVQMALYRAGEKAVVPCVGGNTDGTWWYSSWELHLTPGDLGRVPVEGNDIANVIIQAIEMCGGKGSHEGSEAWLA